jgi:hypothetical protein
MKIKVELEKGWRWTGQNFELASAELLGSIKD